MSVGRPRDRHMATAIRDYEKRAGRYFRFRTIVVPAARRHAGKPARARAEEGEALARRLPRGLPVWALTRHGTPIDSRELADQLDRLATYGEPGVCFLIGGAFGLDESLIEACQRTLTLSALTLPHDLARLILAEPIYRAGTILRGEPYPKGA